MLEVFKGPLIVGHGYLLYYNNISFEPVLSSFGGNMLEEDWYSLHATENKLVYVCEKIQ